MMMYVEPLALPFFFFSAVYEIFIHSVTQLRFQKF